MKLPSPRAGGSGGQSRSSQGAGATNEHQGGGGGAYSYTTRPLILSYDNGAALEPSNRLTGLKLPSWSWRFHSVIIKGSVLYKIYLSHIFWK